MAEEINAADLPAADLPLTGAELVIVIQTGDTKLAPLDDVNDGALVSLAAEVAARVAHEADTTAVHGISDTAALATTGQITAESTARSAAIAAEASTRATADTAESAARVAHAALTTNVHGITDTAGLATSASVTAEASTRAAADTAEASARTAADSAEATTRAAADTTLTNNLAAEVTNRAAAVTTEATARAAADTAEATARATADTTEATARVAHAALTTNVHGIVDTSTLITGADARLSDQRMPLDNSVTNAKVAAGTLGIDRLAVDPRARGTHSGTQTADTISDFTATVRANRLDQLAAPTASVNVNGQRLVGGTLPLAGTDLITKDYADALRAGLLLKADPVRVMLATNVNINSPGAALDSIAMGAGDRVLLTGQTSANDNGIYVWNGAAVPMTRATDANTDAEMRSGAAVWITAGTYDDQRWALITADPITLGVTAQVWSFDGGLAHVTAGAGLTKTGNQIDVGAGTGITVGADTVGITAGGVGTTQLADGGVVDAKVNAAAAIAQSKISGLTVALTARALTPTGAAGTAVMTTGAQEIEGVKVIRDAALKLKSEDSIAFGPELHFHSFNGLGTGSRAKLAWGIGIDVSNPQKPARDLAFFKAVAGGVSDEFYGNHRGGLVSTWGFGEAPAHNAFKVSIAASVSGGSTTIAAGSDGLSLPQTSIEVASTAGFATSGEALFLTDAGPQWVTYTSVDATHFLGCSAGTGVMSTGGAVGDVNMGGLKIQLATTNLGPALLVRDAGGYDRFRVMGDGTIKGSHELSAATVCIEADITTHRPLSMRDVDSEGVDAGNYMGWEYDGDDLKFRSFSSGVDFFRVSSADTAFEALTPFTCPALTADSALIGTAADALVLGTWGPDSDYVEFRNEGESATTGYALIASNAGQTIVNAQTNLLLAVGGLAGTVIRAGASQTLGFFGGSPVAKPTGTPAAATDAATTMALVNILRSHLLTLGLVA